MPRQLVTTMLFGLLAICGTLGCSEAPSTADGVRNAQSRHNIKILLLGIDTYTNKHKEYPDSLDAVKSTMEAGGVSYGSTMANPVTEDSPGYEYVKPTTKYLEGDLDQIILVYQLRNGVRALDLAVGYASGSVRSIGPPSY